MYITHQNAKQNPFCEQMAMKPKTTNQKINTHHSKPLSLPYINYCKVEIN